MISSFFSLKEVTVTSKPSNLYWFDPFADYIFFYYFTIDKICAFEIWTIAIYRPPESADQNIMNIVKDTRWILIFLIIILSG